MSKTPVLRHQRYSYESHLLPIPILGEWSTKKGTQSIDAWREGTAWPLLSALRGFELSDLFDTTRRCRRVTPVRDIHKETELRYCSVCVEEQRGKHWISWWQRSANLPLVAVCPDHHCILSSVPIEKVLGANGYLPHEVVDISRPIINRMDDAALRTASLVTELCRRSSELDPGGISELTYSVTEALQDSLIRTVRERLGQAVAISHPLISGLNADKHYGLTLSGEQDLRIGILITYFETINDLIMSCKTNPAARIFLFDEQDTFSFESILGINVFKDSPVMYKHLRTSCIAKIKHMQDVVPIGMHSVAINILLLFFLDRPWIENWLTEKPKLKSLFKVSDEQLKIGLCLIAEANPCCGQRLKALISKPNVCQQLYSASNIGDANGLFYALCLRSAPYVLRDIKEYLEYY